MSVFKELVYDIATDCHTHGIGIFATTNPDLRTIFVGEMPDELTEGIMLIPVPSPPPHEYIDTEYPVIDFWARSPHSDRAYQLLRLVFDLYQRRGAFDTANWHIYNSHALGNIVDIDRDAEAGKLFRLSVQYRCRNTNHVS